jgi:succinyl-CoA synthetase beta subunit
VKLQILEGGRGKRGLVRVVASADEAAVAFRDFAQASPSGEHPVALVEERANIAAEAYAAVRVDPVGRRYQVLFSWHGGVDVEAAVRDEGDTLAVVEYDPWFGLRPYHLSRALSGTTHAPTVVRAMSEVLLQMHRVMTERDCELIEVNPLALLVDGSVMALDAKVVVDDSAISRQSWASEIQRARPVDVAVGEMARRGIHYIDLGGEVAVISPGAGLNMALIDWLADNGVSANCFLDITGAGVADWGQLFAGQFPTQFAEALGFALEHLVKKGVRTFLINLTSGGSPVDGRVRGILHAIGELSRPDCHFVIHVAGNGQDAAREVLRASGWPVPMSLSDAIGAVVSLARQ